MHSVRLFTIALLALSGASAFAQSSEKHERITAAFALALGREPTPDEARDSGADSSSTVADLIAGHRQRMTSDKTLARATTIRACEDALGRSPTDVEIEAWSTDSRTYSEQMHVHIERLAAHPDEYRQVIDRAYLGAVHRAAYSIEYDYWSKHDTLPFILLAGCIENWAVRNQPGLMSTTGRPSISINSTLLTTVRVSPAVAREAREAIGQRKPRDEALAAALDHSVIAPGASEVVSIGGIHFVATGGPAN